MTNTLSGKKVLVTGASGYFGSVLCERLLSLGTKVHGLSRSARSDNSSGITWWQGDLATENVALKLLEQIKPAIIYHLAGLPDGKRDRSLVLSTFEQNSIATVRLLDAATTVGCERFVYAASMEEPSPHEAFPRPNSPYAASKWVGTIYNGLFHELYKLPTVNLRVFLTYGPGPQVESKLIPYVVTSLLKKQQPKLSSGERLIDVIFIDDVVDAFCRAAVAEKAIGAQIEIGSGKSVSIKEIADKISNTVRSGTAPHYDASENRPREMMPVANLEAAQNLLDWRPRMNLEDGLRLTVEWFRKRKP